MSNTQQLRMKLGEADASQPADTLPTQQEIVKKDILPDAIDETIKDLYAATADLKARIEAVAKTFAASRRLQADLDEFLSMLLCRADEIGDIGVSIEDAGLVSAEAFEKRLEQHAGETEREVAEGIDILLNGPDLSLRPRFEELRRRLAAGETGFDFSEKDPYAYFRDAIMQIFASVR